MKLPPNLAEIVQWPRSWDGESDGVNSGAAVKSQCLKDKGNSKIIIITWVFYFITYVLNFEQNSFACNFLCTRKFNCFFWSGGGCEYHLRCDSI